MVYSTFSPLQHFNTATHLLFDTVNFSFPLHIRVCLFMPELRT